MKTSIKLFLMLLMFIGLSCTCMSQSQTYLDAEDTSILSTEKVIGSVSAEYETGLYIFRSHNGGFVKDLSSTGSWDYDYYEQLLFEVLQEKAINKYGNDNPDILLRAFTINENRISTGDVSRGRPRYKIVYTGHATVVAPIPPDPIKLANENLTIAISKATQRVHPDARIAVDQVKVTNGINEDDFRDKVIEILLDSGYKVVAKEFMQRLYDEQRQQQSGVYNEETTVQGNNFSAVGYYLNIKMTEKSLKVQVINVSTGEYEGNATVNF